MNANSALIQEDSAVDDVLAVGVRDVRAYFDVGNYIEALNVCEGLIACHPDSAEALLLLGLISYELEEPTRALLLLNYAHERAPQIREYADALACVNAELGDDTEALYYAKLATILQPHTLGEALLPDKYSKFFESLRNANPHLFRDRAQRQLEKGNAVYALASCEKQLELSPEDDESWRLLASAALEVGNIERVIDACEFLNAGTLLANDYDVLARAMAKVGRFDEAEQAHSNAIECAPDNPTLTQSRIRTLAARYGNTGGHLERANSDWVAQFANPAETPQQSQPRAAVKDRPLRIAYIGGELHTGPMVDLLTPILAAHDAKHFLPFCYAANERYDMASENLAVKCLRWTDIHGIDTLTIGQILRGDGIDIAVDLSGHGIGSQLQMFAQHPVPVCVSWPITAHPAGAGFDYILASESLAPVDQDAGGVAKAVHRLPAAHLAHRPSDAPETIASLPALRHPHVTLGVMTPLAQIGEVCVKDWSEILDHVPNGRVVVANTERLGNSAATRIYEMATAAGIRDRVDVADLEGNDLNGYGFFDHFDIMLDPQPNSRFLETCRALWMGVPVLAIAGSGYLGRQAAAALSAAGRMEWVFETNQARTAGIADLVADLDRLAQLRSGLRAEIAVSALCDVRSFTRALEQAYRAM